MLVVEDEQMVREAASRVLREGGYEVLEAANGFEALGVAWDRVDDDIHLLLTDIVMPIMGARELVDQFKAVHPESRVLCISGYTDDVMASNGLLGPDAAFLQKPFSPADLTNKVRQVLESGAA